MSKLFGYLSYRDVEVALTLLEALGFETTTKQQDDEGATVHAELRLGDEVVMVAPADEPYEMPKLMGRSTGRGVYLLVDDVTALHGAALQAGGSSVFAPDKTEWGTPASSSRSRSRRGPDLHVTQGNSEQLKPHGNAKKQRTQTRSHE